MERRGLDAAAPDRRRHHQPPAHRGEDRAAATRSATVHVHDASRAVGVVSSRCSTPTAARELDAREPRAAGAAARRRTQKRRSGRCCRSTPRARRGARSSSTPANVADAGVPRAAACSRRAARGAGAATSTGRSSSPPGSSRGSSRRSSTHPSTAPRRASSTTTARALLDRIIARARCYARARSTASGRPAATGDDVVLYADASRARELARFPMLRQQGQQPDGKPQPAASPTSSRRARVGRARPRRRVRGHRGPRRRRARARASRREHDDYNAIMVKALADRLAEAFAECLHARARREWGYGADERLTNEDLIDERYRGIRPAFGYPGVPRPHREGHAVRAARRAERPASSSPRASRCGPAASVSGLYFAHPEARYFTVGRIDRDQVEDYAARKGMSRRRGRALAGAEPGLRPRRLTDARRTASIPPTSDRAPTPSCSAIPRRAASAGLCLSMWPISPL